MAYDDVEAIWRADREQVAEKGVLGALRTEARLFSGLLLVCGVYVGAAVALFPRHYAAFFVPNVLAFAAGATIPLLIIAAWVVHRRMSDPGISRRIAARGLPGLALVFAYLLLLTAYTTYKFNIPTMVPFYADGMLAELDRALHGTDPWRLAHAVAGEWFGVVVVQSYSHLWFALWFGTLLYAAFGASRENRLRYFWANAVTLIVVGTLLATAMSSAGPNFPSLFAEGAQFDALRQSLEASRASGHVLWYIEYLLEAHAKPAGAVGTGISAMPSVHVAIAVLNACFYASLGPLRGAAAWAFAVLILFGSVYTGWHYALDGYVSIVAVSLIWWAACRRIAPLRPVAR